MASDEAQDCKVREGKFVEPCASLAKATDNHAPGFSKRKGIFQLALTNMRTRKPSRTYFGIRSAEYPDGMCFNFCPFCGVQIDQPFNPDSTGSGRNAEQVSA